MKSTLLLFITSTLILFTACGGGNSSGGGGDQATHFSVTGPNDIPSGAAFSLNVTPLDASNKPANYSGIVHLTSSDSKAQLPADTQFSSGARAFSVRLTTAGNQTITVSGTGSISGSSNGINVSPVPGAFAVETFGAKGDGHTDDTVAIQNAINAAASAGGGSVVLKVARYFTTGTLILPAGVVLCGAIQGPFEVDGVDPARAAVAPTLLITNTNAPFITLHGLGSGVTDVLFHYPNQVKSNASAPTVYPYTITMVDSAGEKVARSTVTNAYNFLNIELGRVLAQDLNIGAFNIGVHIDQTYDFVTLHNLHNDVLWDKLENATYPRPIDTWVLNHATALEVNQMDALEVGNFYVFSRFIGINLTFSPDISLPGIRTSWGLGSDVVLEHVQYGIICDATNQPGFEFTNVQVEAAPGLGKAAVQLKAGGTNPPDIVVNGGSVRGTWALGAFPAPEAGNLKVLNVI